ncbi:Uncharacterised protein [Mycobacteroides abscessus subsp. abscessus]|nr:Uncharacterised protein [Mycobacteroides abscessus subsp. abscessus]
MLSRHMFAPTQGRMSSSRCSAILRTRWGSASCARVIPTRSRQPSSIAHRAVGTSAMRAAWRTGISIAFRILRHVSSHGAEGVPMPGIASASTLSEPIVPTLRLRKSMPWAA